MRNILAFALLTSSTLVFGGSSGGTVVAAIGHGKVIKEVSPEMLAMLEAYRDAQKISRRLSGEPDAFRMDMKNRTIIFDHDGSEIAFDKMSDIASQMDDRSSLIR